MTTQLTSRERSKLRTALLREGVKTVGLSDTEMIDAAADTGIPGPVLAADVPGAIRGICGAMVPR